MKLKIIAAIAAIPVLLFLVSFLEVIACQQGHLTSCNILIAIQDSTKYPADLGDSYLNRASIYIKNEDYSRAVSDLNIAVQKQPDSISPEHADNAYQARAWAYFRMKEYQKSLLDYDAALKIRIERRAKDEELAQTYCGRALTKYALFKYFGGDQNQKSAAEDYERSIKLDTGPHNYCNSSAGAAPAD